METIELVQGQGIEVYSGSDRHYLNELVAKLLADGALSFPVTIESEPMLLGAKYKLIGGHKVQVFGDCRAGEKILHAALDKHYNRGSAETQMQILNSLIAMQEEFFAEVQAAEFDIEAEDAEDCYQEFAAIAQKVAKLDEEITQTGDPSVFLLADERDNLLPKATFFNKFGRKRLRETLELNNLTESRQDDGVPTIIKAAIFLSFRTFPMAPFSDVTKLMGKEVKAIADLYDTEVAGTTLLEDLDVFEGNEQLLKIGEKLSSDVWTDSTSQVNGKVATGRSPVAV